MNAQSIEDNLVVINNLLSALTPAVIFGFATHLLQQSQLDSGTFSTGTFLAFNAAFGTFISGATSLSTTVFDILEALPLWERAQPIFQATQEVDTNKADPGRLSGRVEIKLIAKLTAVIYLSALQTSRKVNINTFPLCENIQGSSSSFAVSVTSLFHTTKG